MCDHISEKNKQTENVRVSFVVSTSPYDEKVRVSRCSYHLLQYSKLITNLTIK